MAQTAPRLDDAPLPRRFPSPLRSARAPRLLAADGVWMAALALLTVLISAVQPHHSRSWLPGAVLTAFTVALLYLYGWRARDRAAGVISALLAATSLPFLLHAGTAPLDAGFALLTVGAAFAFLAGSSLLALTLAGLAATVRPDGLLLGIVLLALALGQKRRLALVGGAAFLGVAIVGWAARMFIGHAPLPALSLAPRPWLLTWTVTGGTVFISWLVLPFCAELGDAIARRRWLPLLLWTAAYGIVESFVRVTGREGTVFAFMPLWFALAGGGLSRLLPAVTGDVPLPLLRYGLATIAVLGIVGIRLHSEWPARYAVPTRRAQAPAPVAAAHPPPAPAPMPAPVLPAKPHSENAKAATTGTAHVTPKPVAPAHLTPKPAAPPRPVAPAPAKAKPVLRYSYGRHNYPYRHWTYYHHWWYRR